MKYCVVILQGAVQHYRVGIFNLLAEYVDLHVITFAHPEISATGYTTHILPSHIDNTCLRIQYLRDLIDNIKPSHLVIPDHVSFPSFMLLGLFRPSCHCKVLWWGIDFRSSNFCRRILKKLWYVSILSINQSDLLLYYSYSMYHASVKYLPFALRSFVVNNTVIDPCRVHGSTCKPYAPIHRNLFLHVGSLTHRKKHHLLIHAFKSALPFISPDVCLCFVGSGPALSSMSSLIHDLNLTSRIHIIPATADVSVLSSYYSRAIASVAYYQAGLSVVQSLSFSIPVITAFSAVTGGELANIFHGYNGLVLSGSHHELTQALVHLASNKASLDVLSENSRQSYRSFVSDEKFVEQFLSALRASSS